MLEAAVGQRAGGLRRHLGSIATHRVLIVDRRLLEHLVGIGGKCGLAGDNAVDDAGGYLAGTGEHVLEGIIGDGALGGELLLLLRLYGRPHGSFHLAVVIGLLPVGFAAVGIAAAVGGLATLVGLFGLVSAALIEVTLIGIAVLFVGQIAGLLRNEALGRGGEDRECKSRKKSFHGVVCPSG